MTFDRDRLEQELITLPLEHAIAFAASCSERLIPNYDAFALLEPRADPLLVRQALDEVWQYLRGASFPELRIRRLMEAIVATTAKIKETHPSFFAPLAYKAAVAIHYTLRCCLTGEQGWAAYAAAEAVDCIRDYIAGVNAVYYPQIEIEGPHFSIEKTQVYQVILEKWVAEEAPLTVVELEQQQWDLNRLRAHETLTPDLLDEIRLLSSVLGTQPFLRGLAIESSERRGNK